MSSRDWGAVCPGGVFVVAGVVAEAAVQDCPRGGCPGRAGLGFPSYRGDIATRRFGGGRDTAKVRSWTSRRARSGLSGRPANRSLQVARELGISDGTLGNWVTRGSPGPRHGGDGRRSVRVSVRSCVRLRRENARAGDGARCAQALGRPLGQGSDGAVTLAACIASQRADYGVPQRCRASGAGSVAGLVL